MKSSLLNGKMRLAGILALVLLALGGLATWDEWKTKQEKETEKSKNKLVDVKPEDVIEFDYFSKGDGEETVAKTDDNPKNEGVVEVSGVKKDGIWRLTKPVEVLGDSQSIDALLKTVTDYTYAKVISEKRESWGEYGLLEPRRHLTLRLGGDSPRAITVYFGNKAPIGFDVYLRTSRDDKVLMGSQHILTSTGKTLNDFRDKTLAKIDESKLKNLTYQRAGEPLIEITKVEGKYQIVRPERLEADLSAPKDFIDELNGIKVSGFVDTPDAAAKRAFQTPEIQITWQGETGEASTLKVTTLGGKLAATFDVNQRIFTLPDELKAKLKKELTDFRNRRILEPDSLDAKTVEIDGDIYKNIEGNWYSASDADKLDATGKPKAGTVKPEEKANVRAFMVDLEFAKTDKFLAANDPVAQETSKTAPLHRIILRYHDPNKALVSIELFKAPGADDKFLVKRSGAAYVYRVAKSAFNSMTPSKEAPGAKDGAKGSERPMDDDGGGLNLPKDGSLVDGDGAQGAG